MTITGKGLRRLVWAGPPDHLHRGVSAHVREVDVEEQEIGLVAHDHGDQAEALVEGLDLEARVDQRVLDHPGGGGVILDDEDPRGT
jgi:hypothetical protein